MYKIKLVFTDKEHARAVLRESIGFCDINVSQTINDGFMHIYVMDEDHARRCAAKYKAIIA